MKNKSGSWVNISAAPNRDYEKVEADCCDGAAAMKILRCDGGHFIRGLRSSTTLRILAECTTTFVPERERCSLPLALHKTLQNNSGDLIQSIGVRLQSDTPVSAVVAAELTAWDTPPTAAPTTLPTAPKDEDGGLPARPATAICNYNISTQQMMYEIYTEFEYHNKYRRQITDRPPRWFGW